MTTKELSICLREMARSQKTALCDEWYGGWRDDTNIDKLLNMYVRGFDFAVENDFPNLDFVRKHFDKEDLHRHHIYLDEDVSLDTDTSGTYIFLGRCTGSARFGGFSVATVYLRHQSRLGVSAKDFSKVFVTMYDHSGLSDCRKKDAAFLKFYNRKKE